jgi:DNA-binding IclR family transcriptional regulator
MAYSQNNSLSRAFAILESLNDARAGLTATEVASRTGLPVGTAHRFLKNLAKIGYVAWDRERKAYTIGFALTLFGNRRLVIERIVRRSRPFLRELCQQTGLTAYLGSLEGPQVIIEQRATPTNGSKVAYASGTRLDAHAHSLGKALLALLPKTEIMAIYTAEPLRMHTRHTITQSYHLLRAVADVKVNGYATDDEELRLGTRSIACALVNPKGRALCAIALEGPKRAIGPDRIDVVLAALVATCKKVMQQTEQYSTHSHHA